MIPNKLLVVFDAFMEFSIWLTNCFGMDIEFGWGLFWFIIFCFIIWHSNFIVMILNILFVFLNSNLF